MMKSEEKVLAEVLENSHKYLRLDYSKLAKETGLTRATVYRAVEKLEADGRLKLLAIEDIGATGDYTFAFELQIAPTASSEEIEQLQADLKKSELFFTVMKTATMGGFAFLCLVRVNVMKNKQAVWDFYARMQDLLHNKFKGKIKEMRSSEVISTPKLFGKYSLK